MTAKSNLCLSKSTFLLSCLYFTKTHLIMNWNFSTWKCCLLYKVSRKDSFWTVVMIAIWEQLLRNNPTWQATGTADNLQDGPKALWPNTQGFIMILKSWTPSLGPTLGGIDTVDKYGILRSLVCLRAHKSSFKYICLCIMDWMLCLPKIHMLTPMW